MSQASPFVVTCRSGARTLIHGPWWSWPTTSSPTLTAAFLHHEGPTSNPSAPPRFLYSGCLRTKVHLARPGQNADHLHPSAAPPHLRPHSGHRPAHCCPLPVSRPPPPTGTQSARPETLIWFPFFTDVFLEQNLAPRRYTPYTGERTNETFEGRKAGSPGRAQRKEGQARGQG